VIFVRAAGGLRFGLPEFLSFRLRESDYASTHNELTHLGHHSFAQHANFFYCLSENSNLMWARERRVRVLIYDLSPLPKHG